MKKLIAIVLMLCTYGSASAYPNWILKKEEHNLKIYTAELKDSPFKAVKVECTVRGKLSQLIAAFLDVGRQKEWVFSEKNSILLKQMKDNELIYYSEVSVPWPFANRDFVAHLSVSQPAANVITITSYAEKGIVPERDGIVRIKSSHSQCTLTAMGGDTIKIDYEIQVNPGGAMPAWLTNMFVTSGPCKTFEKIQERMEMPIYQNAHFNFMKQ